MLGLQMVLLPVARLSTSSATVLRGMDKLTRVFHNITEKRQKSQI